jgi:Ca2+-binding RTX toxin-like protein
MAVLRAFEATDMRDDVAPGVVTDFGRNVITVTGGFTTTALFGPFTFSALPNVDDPFFVLFPETFDRLPLFSAGGTLSGYDVREGFRLGYTVDLVNVPAAAALRALGRGDGDGFQRIVFAGDDSLFGSRDRDVLFGYGGNDLISGWLGRDLLRGMAGRDKLYGGDDDDVLGGDGGSDWLYGGDDDDRLLGGDGNDFLDGEDGDDVLQGGRGRDKLRGGADDDSFRFVSTKDSPPGSDHRDVIHDFGRGDDSVDLRRIDADAEARGNQAFTWIGDAPFTGEAGQLRFTPDNRLLAGDTDGDGAADFEVKVNGPDVLTEADVLL